jgi:hypothetical protein
MPTPKKGESEQTFVSRCIPIVLKDKTAKDQEQAAAICYSLFKQHKGRSEEDTVSEFTFTYDEAKRCGVIKVTKSGEELRISNISKEQAEAWRDAKAAEFVKRGFRMQTPSVHMTRGGGDG